MTGRERYWKRRRSFVRERWTAEEPCHVCGGEQLSDWRDMTYIRTRYTHRTTCTSVAGLCFFPDKTLRAITYADMGNV